MILLFKCNWVIYSRFEKNIIEENLFPKLKTQEDYAAWLKLIKKNKAYNLQETLVIWNKSSNSLSSNFFKKFPMPLEFIISTKISIL